MVWDNDKGYYTLEEYSKRNGETYDISNISMASELTAKALDREDGDLTASITVEIISVANRQEDEYVQIYSVVDSNDNTAKLSRKIIVRDDNLDTDGDGTADYLDDDDDGDWP